MAWLRFQGDNIATNLVGMHTLGEIICSIVQENNKSTNICKQLVKNLSTGRIINTWG
jgi:hypothetical protein